MPSKPGHLLRRFLRSRRGAIAPLFAFAAIPLTIAAGSAVDVGRVIDTRSQLQDIADSAAMAGLSQTTPGQETATAQAFVAAAAARMQGNPGVTGAYTFVAGSGVTPATLKVTLSASVATTFAAIFIPKVATSASSKAQSSMATNVVFTISNFNSSALDLNQIYYYPIPAGMSGTTLYQWTPPLAKANLLLSNAANFVNISRTVQVPLNSAVGFALVNTTGGVGNYGSNCYGQAAGTVNTYYSHREDAAGSYWDYKSPGFKACTSSPNAYSADVDYKGSVLLMPCNSADANNVTDDGFAAYTAPKSSGRHHGTGTSSSPNAASTCSSNTSYPAGDYVYYTDVNTAWQSYDTLYGTAYSRNPLKFLTSNTDCSKGNVTYAWDDGGGNDDDNDYNDAVFTVNCTTTGVNRATTRLVS